MGGDVIETIPLQNEESASQGSVLVISRDGTEAARVRRGFEDALLAALRSSRIEALVTPHLYYLYPSHPAVALLEKAPGDLVVGAWMHPRAAFWTLRALGVHGAPGADRGTEGRRVQCLDLGAFASPDECARALDAAAGGRFAPPAAGAPGLDLEEPAGTARARWYPVVDASRCQNCRKCLDFCLFGVYSLRDGKVVVSSPDNCKNGCPACARTCPHGAIMFPHYFGEPAIAGAPPTGSPPPRRAPQPEAEPTKGSPGRPRTAEGEQRDELERLISALEKLDE
jgi:hypothetical protein